jgi:hypothetical protein
MGGFGFQSGNAISMSVRAVGIGSVALRQMMGLAANATAIDAMQEVIIRDFALAIVHIFMRPSRHVKGLHTQ